MPRIAGADQALSRFRGDGGFPKIILCVPNQGLSRPFNFNQFTKM